MIKITKNYKHQKQKVIKHTHKRENEPLDPSLTLQLPHRAARMRAHPGKERGRGEIKEKQEEREEEEEEENEEARERIEEEEEQEEQEQEGEEETAEKRGEEED